MANIKYQSKTNLQCMWNVSVKHFMKEISHFAFSHQYVVEPPSTTRLLEGGMQMQGLGHGKSAFIYSLLVISVAGV